MYDLFKDIEIKPFGQSNSIFADNTILLYFFFFSLIIGLYFLIAAVIAQMLVVELIIPCHID